MELLYLYFYFGLFRILILIIFKSEGVSDEKTKKIIEKDFVYARSFAI